MKESNVGLVVSGIKLDAKTQSTVGVTICLIESTKGAFGKPRITKHVLYTIVARVGYFFRVFTS